MWPFSLQGGLSSYSVIWDLVTQAGLKVPGRLGGSGWGTGLIGDIMGRANSTFLLVDEGTNQQKDPYEASHQYPPLRGKY